METFRTTRCGGFGHPEITVQLTERFAVPNAHRVLIDYFESGVAGGTRFLPGQTVQLGWSLLRLTQRPDGTVGVEERVPSPHEQWVEQIDRSIRDLWYQREIVDSVGLIDRLSFPRQDQAVMVADCTMDAEALLLTRLDPDDDHPQFSGWALRCAADHEHGERRVVPLLAIAANHPSLVQLLALPHGTTVLALYKPKPDAPAGAVRIEPHVYFGGAEIAPRPGSYLAALHG